jgi:microcystin-dependent protein
MASVPESASYDAGIYQLEITDTDLAGATGVMNAQAKGLANRTNWLKGRVNAALRFDAVVSLSAPYTISAADVSKLLYISDMSNAGFTFPAASSFPQGQPLTIMASDQAVNDVVTLTPNGTDKFFDGTVIGGSSSHSIRTGQRLTIVASGSLWWIVGSAHGTRHGRVPAGTSIYFRGASVPSGYLKCNGATVSRISYADLFAAIGTLYGAGDGSTTFNIPDDRGAFMRVVDDGRGLDSGRSIGTYQSDLFKAHNHPGGSLIHKGGGAGSGGMSAQDVNTGLYGDAEWTANVGGTETRPVNNSVYSIIKY